jgi:glycolate oxidase FAD binding subunit
LRDSVLGVEMINGFGERLRFGGEVFKNVAGFDVARLLTGSEGAFGVLLSVSLRVAPKDPCIRAFRQSMPADEAITRMRSWVLRPLPFSGLAWVDGVLHGRLAGAATVVGAACRTLGGEEGDLSFWDALRDRELPCFADSVRSWTRLAPATAPTDADVCIDWAGSLRWRASTDVARGSGCVVGESPLRAMDVDPLLNRIKVAFDPGRIFNPDLLNADAAA